MIPQSILTGTGVNPQSRAKVDTDRTAFWEGRSFRTFVELNVGMASTFVIRVTAVQGFIITQQNLSLDTGVLRFSSAQGGTPGGTFGAALPTFGKNRLPDVSPVPVVSLALASGGTHTGGTESEVIRMTNLVPGQSTANTSGFAQRGLPAGVYYLRFQNTGMAAATGVYSLEWEEYAAPVYPI